MKVIDWKNVNHEFKIGDVVWACAFERTIDANQNSLKQEPILGMFTHDKNLSAEKTNQQSLTQKHIRYFVPFKKNCKAYTLENLAWSKTVTHYSRKYTTTEKECIDLYNSLIDQEIEYHQNIIKEIKGYYI